MILLKGGLVLEGENELIQKDVLIEGGKIIEVKPDIEATDAEVYLVPSCWIIPGAVDVHGHLREPGFEEKETILTGTSSAAKGGITTVMAMANLNPVPDCLENLAVEQEIIDRDAIVHVYPFASVTMGLKGEELVKFSALSKVVKGFSDDGMGFNNKELF
ncbi:MAG TPA: amidohydrolase family protein, partial [Clostridia bacterium]|nr:amidohydrolase family protein [Clostridia bacterium]